MYMFSRSQPYAGSNPASGSELVGIVTTTDSLQILLLFLLYPTSLYYCFHTQVMLFPLPKLKAVRYIFSSFIFPPVFKLYPVYHSKTSPTSSLGGCFFSIYSIGLWWQKATHNLVAGNLFKTGSRLLTPES